MVQILQSTIYFCKDMTNTYLKKPNAKYVKRKLVQYIVKYLESSLGCGVLSLLY
jgi:hypothetical protein